MDTGDPLLRHESPVLLRGVDAVGRQGAAAVPHPAPVQGLDGGLAPPLQAGLVLRLGLRDVDVHPQSVLCGVLGHPPPQRGIGGVLPVDRGVHQDLARPRPMPLLCQGGLVPAVAAGLGGEILWRAEVPPAAGQVGTDARLQDLLRDGPGVHIHISYTGDAGGDHLRQAQVGTGPDGPVVPAGLHREDVVVQPVLEVVAVPIAAHGGHRQVGVGVDKAGEEHLPGAVHHPVKGPLGGLGPHGGDLRPLYRHIGVFQHLRRPVHGHNGHVRK